MKYTNDQWNQSSIGFISVFDQIQLFSPISHHFMFEKVSPKTIIKKEQIIKEFLALYYSNKNDKVYTCKFVLTPQEIFKYSKHNQKLCKSSVRLEFPRIRLYDTKKSHSMCFLKKMYAIRLIGFEGCIDFFFKNFALCKNIFKALKPYCVQLKISSIYNEGKLIGKGNFAKVSQGFKVKNRKIVAIKAISKSKLVKNTRALESARKEIEVMRLLNHPNIIKLIEIFEGKKNLYLVQEFVEGGELFAFIKNQKTYSEDIARKIMKGILSGLAHCHSKNIVHRDLKLENLILVDCTNDFNIKIADFGLATVISPKTIEKQRCGSPGYIAPEIFQNSGYDCKVDVFSAGIVLHILLTGQPAFFGLDAKEVLKKNFLGKVEFNNSYWSHVSKEGLDLCRQMTMINPSERISASEALNHKWFNLEINEMSELNDAFENILKYKMTTKISLSKLKEEENFWTRTPLMLGRIIIKDLTQDSPGFTPRSLKQIRKDSSKSQNLLITTLKKEFYKMNKNSEFPKISLNGQLIDDSSIRKHLIEETLTCQKAKRRKNTSFIPEEEDKEFEMDAIEYKQSEKSDSSVGDMQIPSEFHEFQKEDPSQLIYRHCISEGENNSETYGSPPHIPFILSIPISKITKTTLERKARSFLGERSKFRMFDKVSVFLNRNY